MSLNPEVCPAEGMKWVDTISCVFPPQEAVLCQDEVVGMEPAGLDIAIAVLAWLGVFAAFSWVLNSEERYINDVSFAFLLSFSHSFF